MTTPNTPNPMQDDHGNYIDEFGLTQRFDLTEWWIQKGVPFTNAPARKRYSRKAWRLKKEIEKITDTPQYKKASDNAMHNTLIGAPVEVIFRPDGSVEVPRYQIGDNDCEFCKG